MKDIWDKIQVIFTVITALSAGIWGAFIYFNQRDINEKQQEISNRLQTLDRTIKSVDSMVPYIDKIVDKDPAKAKLSAYAIYILNKDNPNLAVSLISAVGKQELTDLLKEIGKTDPEIAKIISGLFPSPETAKPTQEKTAATASREEILEALQTAKSGWCYLGNFSKNTWSRKTIQIGENEFPKPDTVYQIIDDVYLRDKEPQPPNYTLGAVIGINREGGKIKIDKVVQIPDKDWVWAKVTVISQAQK